VTRDIPEFRALRLPDLEDELGPVPHRLVGGDDLCTRALIVVVGDAAPRAGPRLNQDLMAAAGKRRDARRCDGDPELFVHYLFDDTDLHGHLPCLIDASR